MVLLWKFCPEVCWQKVSSSLTLKPLCLISSSQDADYRETVQARTYILLCVRDSTAVHLPPQIYRYAQSHYCAAQCNRIVGRVLLQCWSMYKASLKTEDKMNKSAPLHFTLGALGKWYSWSLEWYAFKSSQVKSSQVGLIVIPTICTA